MFKQGKEDGLHQWWFPSGQLDQEVNYRNGKTEGLVKNWYESGQLKLESQYSNGVKEGKTTKWHPNGVKKSEELFVTDQPNGNAQYWNKKGIIQAVRIYDQGRLVQEKNYRSGSINIGDGYVQVYNEAESFFKVKVAAEQVRPLDTKGVSYVIDGMLLKMFNIRWREFIDSTRQAETDKELLERYLAYESDLLQATDSVFQFEVKPEWQANAGGKTILFWSFKAPSSLLEEQKPRTVQEEYYLSLVCNQQILTLYSPRTNSDNPTKVRAMLRRLADATNVESERIDLNALLTSKP